PVLVDVLVTLEDLRKGGEGLRAVDAGDHPQVVDLLVATTLLHAFEEGRYGIAVPGADQVGDRQFEGPAAGRFPDLLDELVEFGGLAPSGEFAQGELADLIALSRVGQHPAALGRR